MSKKVERVIIDFPKLSKQAKAVKITITAHMPATARDLCSTRLNVLQQAYDGKLNIGLDQRHPVITFDTMARTVAGLTGPAHQLAKQIRAHTGFETLVAAH